MNLIYGQLVIGPPGSGKTTYCSEMYKFLKGIGRKVAVINMDPANDNVSYESIIDIKELIMLEDVMEYKHLGPNGALVYSLEYLEKELEWLKSKIDKLREEYNYLLIDCPGQVEIYTHNTAMKNITSYLQSLNIRLCAVHLVDSHYCSDPGKFISACLLSLSAMLRLELPHVNILSKIDQIIENPHCLPFGMEFYTEILDLSHILEFLEENTFTAKYAKLNETLSSLVQDYSLVSFYTLDVKNQTTLKTIKNAVDRANGYYLSSKEETSTVQDLLSKSLSINNSMTCD